MISSSAKCQRACVTLCSASLLLGMSTKIGTQHWQRCGTAVRVALFGPLNTALLLLLRLPVLRLRVKVALSTSTCPDTPVTLCFAVYTLIIKQCKNAYPEKGPPSKTGLHAIELQNALPNARVVYCKYLLTLYTYYTVHRVYVLDG